MSAPLRIVATLALDDRDDAVLAAVRALTARRATDVTLLHVQARAGAGIPDALAAAAARLGVPATTRVVAGTVDHAAESVLLEVGADLLVVGRSAAADGAAAWGPHGRALLRAAGCPVLVVPVGSVTAFGRAALGMDLSPSALDALVLARGLFDDVLAIAVLAPEDAAAGAAEVIASLEARFHAALAARGLPAAPLAGRAGSSPADVLLALAPEVDVLVVGSRGLSPLATVLLGSTAERLAGRNHGPVLVVRRRGDTRGLLGALFRP
jgi:nucleotide-binding universal stress UspA family protein